DIGLDSFGAQRLDGLQAFFQQRNLNHDVFMQLRQFAAFGNNFGGGQRDGFQADRAIHDVEYFGVYFQRLAACLGNVRWVGRDAVNDAPTPRFADLSYVRRIEK